MTTSFNTNQRTRKAPTPPRIRRRRRLVWLSIVPAFIVFLHGVHLTALNGNFAQANKLYQSQEWRPAYREFSLMRSPNYVEPWKAHFNTGTAALRDAWFNRAADALEAALPLAPEEHVCDVATNLAHVYAGIAEEYITRSDAEHEHAVLQREEEAKRLLGEPYDASVFKLDYDDNEITSAEWFEDAARSRDFAASYFALASAAINHPACQTPPPPSASSEEQEESEAEQEEREQEQERLENESRDANEERQEIEREASGTEEQEETEGPEGETEEERQAREEAERQEELEQRNEDAEEEAESGGDGDGDSDSESDGEDPGSGGPPISNW